jgi:hypothetical protein
LLSVAKGGPGTTVVIASDAKQSSAGPSRPDFVARLLGFGPRTPPNGRPGGDFVVLLRFAAETPGPPPTVA